VYDCHTPPPAPEQPKPHASFAAATYRLTPMSLYEQAKRLGIGIHIILTSQKQAEVGKIQDDEKKSKVDLWMKSTMRPKE
jgi:hypothetical protein